MDSVRSGPYGQIFRPDNFVFGQVCTVACASTCMTVFHVPTRDVHLICMLNSRPLSGAL